jgi:hypothetical protein
MIEVIGYSMQKKVDHYNPSLPNITIRAPHPKTIRIQSWENGFIEYVQQLA